MVEYHTRLTFSHANSTGAVARPNFKSAAVGLPIASADDTKSSRSSTSWKANPMLRPYWKATSAMRSSAPPRMATCPRKDTTDWIYSYGRSLVNDSTYRLQAVGYQRGGLAVRFREVVIEALVLTLLAAQLHELALNQIGQDLEPNNN